MEACKSMIVSNNKDTRNSIVYPVNNGYNCIVDVICGEAEKRGKSRRKQEAKGAN
jgi:hypothetical protein